MTTKRWFGWMVVVACSPADGGPTTGTATTGTATTGMATSGAVTGTSVGSPGTSGEEGSTNGEAPTSGGTPGSTSTGVDASTGPGSGSSTGPGDVSTSSGGAESSTGAPPPLRVEPPAAVVEVTSGWSFPLQFTALVEGSDVPVEASWTVDAPIGRITRHGGTFAARNTAGGVVQVSAEFDGQIATADVEVVIVDDHPVCPPRPPLTDEAPAPGKFVKVVAPEYMGTGVYHGLYLPPDWTPGRRYPVIVESPCNTYGQFTGKVDDTRLGYYFAGCRHYVWIVVPYIQAQANLDSGWGELGNNVDYWPRNVQRALDAYGGDPGAVIVAGFSRGAIGTSWIGLQDDAIADQWLGFFMHSHADVITNLTPDGGAGSATRMGRVGGRAALLTWGGAGDGGKGNSTKGVDLLTSLGTPVTAIEVPGVGHTDAWIVDDAATHAQVQGWLFDTVAARPGTGAVYGRVTDFEGNGQGGVRVTSGPLHADTTDEFGYYGLRGLRPGMRVITCEDPACGVPQMVDVGVADVEDVDFVAGP